MRRLAVTDGGKAMTSFAPFSAVASLPDSGRFAYSPITQRPQYTWPNGAKLALYLGFNVEHFAFAEGLGACIGPPSPQPDVLNYSWREYGNRVGAWRCLELFDALKMPTGALINTALYDHEKLLSHLNNTPAVGSTGAIRLTRLPVCLPSNITSTD